MRGESCSGRSTNHNLHSAIATIVLWPGSADGLRSKAQAPCVVCTQHINAPTAAAASHCFTCRSESDRMLLLLSSACVKTYTWMFIATGLPRAVRTGVPTPCPWLGARARRRCRSKGRPGDQQAQCQSVFEDSKALQPLRLPAVASAASRSGSGVTCVRNGCDARATEVRAERRLSEKLRFAVCGSAVMKLFPCNQIVASLCPTESLWWSRLLEPHSQRDADIDISRTAEERRPECHVPRLNGNRKAPRYAHSH